MQMVRWWSVLLVMAVLTIGGLPAAAKKDKGREFSGNTVYTDYHLTHIKLDDIAKSQADKLGVTHPAVIPAEKMRQMVASISLNRRSMFKKAKVLEDSAVFGERDVDRFADYLAEAFQRATGEQIVVFSYLVRNSKMLGGLDRLNTGKAWVSGHQLHIAFDKLYALITADVSKRGYDDKSLRGIKGLRVALEAGPGQMLGDNVREIVLDTGATFVVKDRSGPAKRLPASTTQRLQELKTLLDKKLITKEEYDAKRQMIMNNL